MAQNSKRIAMMDGDSGTLEGSHVPDGMLTSMVFGIAQIRVHTPCEGNE